MMFKKKTVVERRVLMKEDTIKGITDTLMLMRPVMINKFIKPIKEIKRDGIPFPLLHIMHVAAFNKNISMSSLAEKTCISKSNLTPLVDKLIAAGLIERLPDEEDRRIIHLCLTDKGRQEMEDHKIYVKALINNKLQTLEESDLKRFHNALKEIFDIMKLVD
jgi:DNA-binding MarR family transcriptional regulator